MKTTVEFRSAKFPPYDGEEDQINPNLWGKRLVEYLTPRLRAEGIPVEDFFAEDWGWRIEIRNEAFPLYICCGHYEEYPDGYICNMDPDKPVIRRWFKKIDTTPAVAPVVAALAKILAADAEIRDIIWWDDEVFMRGGKE